MAVSCRPYFLICFLFASVAGWMGWILLLLLLHFSSQRRLHRHRAAENRREDNAENRENCLTKDSEVYKEVRGGRHVDRERLCKRKERWITLEEEIQTDRQRERERSGQAYEQRVTAQSLEVGKSTQEVSKSNLWEFALQIVFRANTGA